MGQPLTDDLGFLLSRASGAVVRVTNAGLTEHGLRVRQYSVLALACEGPDGIGQRALAGVLGLDPSQVVLLVDELVAAGLVERRPDPADRRKNLVVATTSGRQRRADAGAVADAAVAGALGLVSERERADLRDVLTRIWAAAG